MAALYALSAATLFPRPSHKKLANLPKTAASRGSTRIARWKNSSALQSWNHGKYECLIQTGRIWMAISQGWNANLTCMLLDAWETSIFITGSKPEAKCSDIHKLPSTCSNHVGNVLIWSFYHSYTVRFAAHVGEHAKSTNKHKAESVNCKSGQMDRYAECVRS